MPSQKVSDAAKELGRLGGLKGGPETANRLSPEERRARAKKAADARWDRVRADLESQRLCDEERMADEHAAEDAEQLAHSATE